MARSDYPIDVRVAYPERSSRGWAALTILLIKFLALIPHFFALLFLGIAQFFVALVAQVAVAASGEYPAGMFDFVAGVLRWGTRVAAFIVSLDDRYPPFTLRPVADYPVDVELRRPAQSSRLYALFTVIVEVLFIAGAATLAVILIHRGVHVRRGYNFPSNSWTGLFLRQIAALPHIIVLFFLGIAVFVVWVIVQWVILFTARFPRGMFDFVAGFVRWQTRVSAYTLGLSDLYPPFSFEPSLTAPEPAYPAGPPPLAPYPTGPPPLAPQPSGPPPGAPQPSGQFAPQPSPPPQATVPPGPLPPAQWYADPSGRHTHRYWDGARWTSHVADQGRAGEDPLDAPGSGPPG